MTYLLIYEDFEEFKNYYEFETEEGLMNFLFSCQKERWALPNLESVQIFEIKNKRGLSGKEIENLEAYRCGYEKGKRFAEKERFYPSATYIRIPEYKLEIVTKMLNEMGIETRYSNEK